MGAKTWMLVYSEGDTKEVLLSKPQLDREESLAFAKVLFPKAKLQPIEDGDLSFTSPPGNKIYVGCFPGLKIVAASEFGRDHPSRLTPAFLQACDSRFVYLHAMHSVVDWFAYAIWENGELKRSLSLSPDSGVLEDIGPGQEFEDPFWSGDRPVFDPGEEEEEYPLPFHPLELGEAALLSLFGYQLEGMFDASQVSPEEVPLLGFKRTQAWWRRWL